jgi:membrane protein YqaA with SNARE-associated domain
MWSLLGSWLPIVGDPLTVVAGLMRAPLVPFLALVTFAKGARYIVLAALVMRWF